MKTIEGGDDENDGRLGCALSERSQEHVGWPFRSPPQRLLPMPTRQIKYVKSGAKTEKVRESNSRDSASRVLTR
jgi:hypothetical protein